MRPKLLFSLACATALTGCSGGAGLSTSSILGGSDAAAAPAAPVATPTSRALQVGATAARATKCGYNFDKSKLRTNFLASEAAQGSTAELTNLERTYDTAYSGVSKAAASKPDYCNPAKTAEIKQDLTRHLAGDFSPAPPKPVEQEEGLFSGWGSGSSSGAPEYKATLPTDNSRD